LQEPILNLNPEQVARQQIDLKLIEAGWLVQNKKDINLGAGVGIAVREYQTAAGPADYVLFVHKKPVGVIEAKQGKDGYKLTVVEEQSVEYATAKLKYLDNDALPFVYESTGEYTKFTDYRDPKPRARPVFSFHTPETFAAWVKQTETLRGSLLHLPLLPIEGLRDCQVNAINNLEHSFKENRPRALIQMATGSGKTFTAITFIYRLLKYAGAKRVLFLVDTKNLGEQAEQEFNAFLPNDDNRKFTELYGVHRLKSSFIPTDNQVYISTIQRLYSVLKGAELDEAAEEENPNEKWQPKEVPPIGYNHKLPIEFFDFVVIDECHRSIYNLWKQVLEYFDSFLTGLTATPDNRTFGFFNQNVVSDYGFEKAVADGVLVPYNEFVIETEITKNGAEIMFGEYVDKRERMTRKKFWEQLDEDVTYSARRLDDDIVNPSQIRTIIQTFRDNLPAMFPDRFDEHGVFEVPKTLIFAKSDSHADDIINIVREEFAEENRFCKKITYKADDPKGVLAQFRNDYSPRIAVTVDMIATGTDVKPLECLLFMRDVKSRNYFEQMKGRGTRTLSIDDLHKVSKTAKYTKDHFVIVDAVGVTRSLKTDSRALEKKQGVALKDLLAAIAAGARGEDLFTSVANRLARLNRQLTIKEQQQFAEKANGKTLPQVVGELLNAYNPDTIEQLQNEAAASLPEGSPQEVAAAFKEQHSIIIEQAAETFTGELNNWIEQVRKSHEQVIDHINQDTVLNAGWDKDNKAQAATMVQDFKQWMDTHKDEITALQIFYNQPYRRRDLTYKMIKELLEMLKADKPVLAPMYIWRAYELAETANGVPKNELIALVSLVRHICGVDGTLTSYDKTVDANFKAWVFKKQAGAGTKYTEDQMHWLRMIKEHVATSMHLDADDLDYTPFDAEGGKGKMWQLFGEGMDGIINELNEELAA
jgi:type I restriction enzyme R subunit